MPNKCEIGPRRKCSTAASTPDGAKSVSLFKRLFAGKPKSNSYPGISGVDITNGLRYLTAVEIAVGEGIRRAPKRERRNVLLAYKTAFHLAKRGIVNLMHKMDEEGEL